MTETIRVSKLLEQMELHAKQLDNMAFSLRKTNPTHHKVAEYFTAACSLRNAVSKVKYALS